MLICFWIPTGEMLILLIRSNGIFEKGVLKTLVMLSMSIILGGVGVRPKIKDMKHIINISSILRTF